VTEVAADRFPDVRASGSVLPSALGSVGDSAGLRKARGAFFTPVELARYISRWALRTATDRVLEPSCGEAAFLLAAADRLDELGATAGVGQLVGAELHSASAARAQRVVAQAGWPVSIMVGDFFALPPARECTVGKLTPTRRPTSALLVPSAASNTIRARCANPAEIVEDRVHSRSLCSSPARNTNGSTRDIRHCLNHRQQSHFQHATLVLLTTIWTSLVRFLG
jgi:hypothetical protein